jgi:predicted ATP-dependent endonuclease of OLD family
MSKQKKIQIILTTHSTLFMDYFAPESILMLKRNKSGGTIAEKVFDNEELKQQLEYMYPGEIILNMSGDENE